MVPHRYRNKKGNFDIRRVDRCLATKADVSSVSLSSERIEELWVVRGVKGERMSSAIGGVPSIFIFFLPTFKTETPKRF